MPIRTDNNYEIFFRVGPFQDFIKEEHLIEFSLVEYAGGLVPEFVLTFVSDNDAVINYLNEGNEFKVSFGKDSTDTTDMNLFVFKMESSVRGGNQRTVAIKGFLSTQDFFMNRKTRASEPMSATELAESIGEDHFSRVDTNVTTSEDTPQVWIQHNITDRRFITNAMSHAWSTKGFFATAITMENEYRIRDMILAASNGHDWKFTVTASGLDNTEFEYDPGPTFVSNTGFGNYWAGYGRKELVYDIDLGNSEFASPEIKPVLALTQDIARNAKTERKFAGTRFQSDNVHPKYWQANLKNTMYSVILGNVIYELSFTGKNLPVKVLDLVMFIDKTPSDNEQMETVDFNSGLYVVKKVSKHVVNRQFVTKVWICREGFNEIKGDNLVREDEVTEETSLFSALTLGIFDEDREIEDET